jgi:predicted dehydrogenase
MGRIQQDKEVKIMSSKELNRRDLLKQAAAAAGTIAFPYCITSTALGDANTPAVSERVALGHIGVGGQGSGLLENFLRIKDAQCVAVADPIKERREGWISRIGCAAYNDFRELLARKDVDAVVVATQDHWHVPIAIMAAKAGKDMYVEKPLGISIEHDKAARKAVRDYSRIFQYGTQQRSDRNFRFACELARNKYIGELKEIHAWCSDGTLGGSTAEEPVPAGFDYDMWLGPALVKPFNHDRCLRTDTSKGTYHIYDYAIGFIAGWGAHPLDIAQWGNDTDNTAPVLYQGKGTLPKEGLFDTTLHWDINCTYKNGVKLHFMSTTVAGPIVGKYRKMNDHGTTFIGDKGWVSVDRGGIYAQPEELLDIQLKPSDLHLYESSDHYANFVQCVQNRKDPICTVESAAQSDFICHLSDIVVRTGRPVKWDPKNEKILDNPEAQRYTSRAMRSPWTL